jgi:hypothetical protein
MNPSTALSILPIHKTIEVFGNAANIKKYAVKIGIRKPYTGISSALAIKL